MNLDSAQKNKEFIMLKIKPFFSIAFLVLGLIILGGFIHHSER